MGAVCANDILYLEEHGNNTHVYIVKNHWNVLKIYKFYVNLLNINLREKMERKKQGWQEESNHVTDIGQRPNEEDGDGRN